jgi:hypothetical protein
MRAQNTAATQEAASQRQLAMNTIPEKVKSSLSDSMKMTKEIDVASLLPVIEDWASVRRYEEKPIPEEVLRRILEAARKAPSWGNVQPWHFVVVRDKEKKELLKDLGFGQKYVVKEDAVVL